MRRLLKFINYAAQLMALIDIGKTIKRRATKNDDKSDGQAENKTWELDRLKITSFFLGGYSDSPFLQDNGALSDTDRIDGIT